VLRRAPEHEARLTPGDLLAAHIGGLLAEVERTGARDAAPLLDRRPVRAVNPVA
jgi:hypothetical protein